MNAAIDVDKMPRAKKIAKNAAQKISIFSYGL